ncbi:MAG: hypothetical protein ACREQC_08700, partial [Candidatus Binataceae bacterium]
MRRTSKLRGAMLAGLILASSIRPLAAQEAARAAKDITFYVDQESGQVFIRPAKSRVPLMFGGAAFRAALEQTVEEKTRDEVRAAVAESEAAQRAQTAELQKQVAEIKPAWKSYLNNFQNKFRIGALFYADYGLYTHTGFGPQFLENQNPPGPGNNFFNAFDISRVYLNTYFSPTDDWTFRFTPEIYRANGANQTTTSCLTTSGGVCSLNDKFGATSAVGSNLDGALNVRLKFAFLQNSALWNEVPALEGGTLTIGAQPNPLLGWEEDFTQYRFVYLSPWNYLGLSSSQIGFQFAGPVTFRAGEDTYLDYAVGAYDN